MLVIYDVISKAYSCVKKVNKTENDTLFLLEKVAIFFVTETGSQIKYLILHISIIGSNS